MAGTCHNWHASIAITYFLWTTTITAQLWMFSLLISTFVIFSY